MLNDSTVAALIAVNDLEKGKEFYGGVLGLEVLKESKHGVLYAAGQGKLAIYPSSVAGKCESSVAMWMVDDLEVTMQSLQDRGVTFEKYGDPDADGDKRIARFKGQRGAWFKDPDGNILYLREMPLGEG